jgi:hypothetical protein
MRGTRAVFARHQAAVDARCSSSSVGIAEPLPHLPEQRLGAARLIEQDPELGDVRILLDQGRDRPKRASAAP